MFERIVDTGRDAAHDDTGDVGKSVAVLFKQVEKDHAEFVGRLVRIGRHSPCANGPGFVRKTQFDIRVSYVE